MTSDDAEEFIELIGAIYALNDEDELTHVFEAYRERTKQLRAQRAAANAATVKVGDRVRLSDALRPKRFANATGELVSRSGTKFSIRLDSGEHITTRASAFTKEGT